MVNLQVHYVYFMGFLFENFFFFLPVYCSRKRVYTVTITTYNINVTKEVLTYKQFRTGQYIKNTSVNDN